MSEIDPIRRKLRVAVLMGGTSSERPVSLSTGKMILGALDTEKYTAFGVDTSEIFMLTSGEQGDLSAGGKPSDANSAAIAAGNSDAALTEALLPASRNQAARPDVVFVALHGKGGEDGTVQGMLELLGLPYTGSGVLASALAMDKAMSKRLFRAEGIPVIDAVLVPKKGAIEAGALIAHVAETVGFPVFVKPNAEGSTFGCALVDSPEALIAAVENALKYDDLALIEQYIRGTEITVGILGNAGDALEALPVIEIVPKNAYYDYESKYSDGGSEHIIPARISEASTQAAQEIARRCHVLLGCRGMSRTDLILSGDRLFVLEVNTIPGMTPTSLLPQAADHAGIPFSSLLDRIITAAMQR